MVQTVPTVPTWFSTVQTTLHDSASRSITWHHLAASPRFIVLCHGSPCRINLSFCSLRSGETCQRRNTSVKIMKEQKCVPTVCPRSLHRGCSLSHRPTHPVATQWTWWRPSINKLHPAVPSVSSHSPNSTKTTLWSLWTAWQLSHCTE